MQFVKKFVTNQRQSNPSEVIYYKVSTTNIY